MTVPLESVCCLGGLLIIVLLAGLWGWSRGSERATKLYRRCLLPGAVALLAAGGWWAADWRGDLTDQQLRQRLLAQAVAVARTINPERVKALSFSEADLTNPSFQRLRAQLRAYAQALGQRSVYSLALRDGQLVFGPESLDEQDAQASRPGTIYRQPTPELRDSFNTASAFTEGPVADEYGTFVSGFAPVKDPRTGRVLMTIGLDLEARHWQAALGWQRLLAFLIALALIALLLCGSALLRWRKRWPERHQQRWRHAEAYLTAVWGCVLTAILALVARDGETRSRQLVFSQLADARAERITGSFVDVRDHQLETLARFIQGHQPIARKDFQHFTDIAILQPSIAGVGWAPRVTAAEQAGFVAQMRGQGFADFSIFQADPAGRRRPAEQGAVHYPIALFEPYSEVQTAVGYDLHSETEHQWQAAETALQTGLATATDVTRLIGAQDRVVLVYAPLWGDRVTPSSGPAGTAEPRGVIFVALRLDTLLCESVHTTLPADEAVVLDAYQVAAGVPPQFLASSSREERHAPRLDPWPPGDEAGLSGTYPVFAFGRAYALHARPGPAFYAAHPARAGWAVGWAGLFLTAVTTCSIGFLSQRRIELEDEVRARTAALRASEEHYRLIAENTADVIWKFDLVAGRFTYVSPAVQADAWLHPGRSPGTHHGTGFDAGIVSRGAGAPGQTHSGFRGR